MDAATSGASPAYTPEQLLQFVQAGVFTIEEVRNMVRKSMGCAASPATPKVTTPKVTTPKVATQTPPQGNPNPVKRIKHTRLVFAPAASPSVGKSRKRKDKEDPESKLRDVVRNTARRRFFNECCKLDSKLWEDRPNSDKQFMHRLLFKRAAEEVINVLHAEQPGRLRKTTDAQIEDTIRWQVARDRNNYAGKTPKRNTFIGTPMAFDFDGEYLKIQKSLKEAQDLTVSPCTIPSQDEVKERLQQNSEEQFDEEKLNKSFINMCLICREHVWTGPVEDCPPAMQLAHPFQTDWIRNANAQPYCLRCWQEEEKVMNQLGQEHCAVGPKTKKGKKLGEAIQEAQKKAIQESIARAKAPPADKPKRKRTKKKKSTKPKKKRTKKQKQLGGVRTSDLVTPKPLKWWKVCVCVYLRVVSYVKLTFA